MPAQDVFMQQTLDLPNPEAWCDSKQAAAILGIGRSALYNLLDRGVVHDYKIGTVRLFWRNEIADLKSARDRVKGRGTI